MRGSSPSVTPRPLSQQDASALATFACRRYREPWSEAVEEMIQGSLAGEIISGNVAGLGLWLSRELIGVAAWRAAQSPPGAFKSIIVAVRTGHQGRGYGRRLKQAMIEVARQEGATVVVSEIHWSNAAMIHLNESFGGSVERIPGDWDYGRCIIPL